MCNNDDMMSPLPLTSSVVLSRFVHTYMCMQQRGQSYAFYRQARWRYSIEGHKTWAITATELQSITHHLSQHKRCIAYALLFSTMPSFASALSHLVAQECRISGWTALLENVVASVKQHLVVQHQSPGAHNLHCSAPSHNSRPC